MIADPFTDIVALVKSVRRCAHQAELQYTREVDALIHAHSRDANHIEHTLDGMLSFCFDPAMLLLYKKLCRYYFKIDQAATAFYVNAYREMWDAGETTPRAVPRKSPMKQRKPAVAKRRLSS